jgi:hypothetical protein
MALSEHMDAGESKGKTPAPVPPSCFVYILMCSDGTLYVGSTSDLVQHVHMVVVGRVGQAVLSLGWR